MQTPLDYSADRASQRAFERATRIFELAPAPTPRESFRRVLEYDVHVDEHLPRGPARGTVLMIHGAGAHGRMLAPFAAPLCARGLRVLAPDLPGYGLTRGNFARTEYDEWIAIAAQLARDAASDGPVLLFGLSVGGLTALRAAQRAPEVGGVIATTLLDLGDPGIFDRVAKYALLGRIARFAFRRAPALSDRVSLPLAWVAPLSAMTSDRALARELIRDPLLGRRRVAMRFFRSLHGHRDPRTDFDLPCPVLLVHPGADHWTPLELSLPVFERIGSDKTLVRLSGGAHAPLEPQAFAELDAAIGAFLERVLAVGDAAQR